MKATITLTDEEEGTLGVKLEFDPPAQKKTNSIAAHMAMVLMERLTEEAKKHLSNEDTVSEIDE